MVDLETRAADVRSAVRDLVADASTSIRGRTVEVSIEEAHVEASASEDLSEIEARVRRTIRDRFGYDVEVDVHLAAEKR